MWTKDILFRLKKELGIEVNDDTLFFYDRINLVPIKRNPDNNYREYTEKDYIKLSKAVILSKTFAVSLEDIDRIFNKDDKGLKERLYKLLTKHLRILKETT